MPANQKHYKDNSSVTVLKIDSKSSELLHHCVVSAILVSKLLIVVVIVFNLCSLDKEMPVKKTVN